MENAIRSFDTMWAYTNTIPGSFTEAEARAMYALIKELPPESVLVEIGSYCGRSSSLLGQLASDMGHEFTCVDSFITGFNGIDVEQEFKKNMDRTKLRYQLMPWTSQRASHLFNDHEIDFLFIDGDHRFVGVKKDLDSWYEKCRNIICFHDYQSSWIDVKSVVDMHDFKFQKSSHTIVVDSMAIRRVNAL